MLTSNKSILATLALLRAHGVRHFVLCPGSRNAGMVHSVCQIKEFQVHTATDERTAGFLALGLALAENEAVAVIVTSGSAVANLYPSACEAYYQHVPVIYISADRPAAWIGQMDGQTMPQENALGHMVKMSVNLPEDNPWHANRLLNEAIICCRQRMPRGPVHINIPVSEPIYDFSIESLPQERVIRLCQSPCDLAPIPSGTLLLVGQMSPDQAFSDSLIQTASKHITIVAETLSNLPPSLITNPTSVYWERMPQVDLVITIGGHLISKDLKEHFRNHPPKEHWHVSPNGDIADLFCHLTVALQENSDRFLQDFLHVLPPSHSPLRLPLRKPQTPSLSGTRQQFLSRFFELLPQDTAVFLANSSTVRIAQQCVAETGGKQLRFFCNRGINGIEGSLSTAVGYAMARPKERVFMVLGDLSFFYDSNALWCAPLPDNLHILLLNDGKGAIFETLPLPAQPEMSRHAIMGRHTLSAKHIAQLYGVSYLKGDEWLELFVNFKHTIIYEILENH